jgi:hypothetical protein
MKASKIMSTNPLVGTDSQSSLTIPSTASLEIIITRDRETSEKSPISTPIYEMMILQARKERPSGPLFAERSSLAEVKSTSETGDLPSISQDIPRITIEIFDSDGKKQPVEETLQDLKGTGTND